jgi:hypothetical protein
MALETNINPWHIAVALGQPAPPTGSVTEEQWQMWIDDNLMFIQDRATTLGVADADMVQAKIDFVIREVVVDQVKRRDTDTDAQIVDGYTFRTIADWWPLLGLTGSSGAFSLDMASGSSSHLPWCSAYFGAAYCSCGVDIAGYPIFEGGVDAL